MNKETCTIMELSSICVQETKLTLYLENSFILELKSLLKRKPIETFFPNLGNLNESYHKSIWKKSIRELSSGGVPVVDLTLRIGTEVLYLWHWVRPGDDLQTNDVLVYDFLAEPASNLVNAAFVSPDMAPSTYSSLSLTTMLISWNQRWSFNLE